MLSIKFEMIIRKFKEIFGIDLRSLALFRVGISLVLLADLFQRARYLEAHYTDLGVMPRDTAIQSFMSIYKFSFHLMNGTSFFQSLLFAINAAIACALLVGFRTKLMTVLSWFFLISLHNRNSLVTQGGDVLLRLFLFWSIFLPLGARFSYDHFKGKYPKLKNHFFSAASFAFVMQILILYFCAASHKISDNWIKDYTAVYQALNADHFATSLGVWLRELRWPLPYLTKTTVYLEFALPFLLICPFFFKYVRLIGVALSVCLHVGFASSLNVGFFWVIDVFGVLGLLPGLFWEHVQAFYFRDNWLERAIALFYSKICYFLDHLLKFFSPWAGLLKSIVISFFVLGNLIYVLFIVAPYFPYSEYVFPEKQRWYGKLFGLDQRWQMFSPIPMSNDGWFVIDGRLKDGTHVDVLTSVEGAVSFEKPKNLSQTFVTQRWRKFFRQLLRGSKKKKLSNYAKAVCRNWNGNEIRKNKKLEKFKIYYMLERTKPNYEIPKVKKKMMWRHYCFKVPKEGKAVQVKARN